MKEQTRISLRGGLAAVAVLVSVACATPEGGALAPPPTAADGGGAASMAGQVPAPLLGPWSLVTLQRSGQPTVSIPAPDRFKVSFGADGRASLVADCNACSAAFEASHASLAIGLMACTRAYCSSAPLDTDFAGLVQAAKRWAVQGNDLTLSSASGTLRLRR